MIISANSRKRPTAPRQNRVTGLRKLKPGRINLALILLIPLLLAPPNASAGGRQEDKAEESTDREEGADRVPQAARVRIRYARGFTVEYSRDHKIVTVLNPWRGSRVRFRYILVQRGTPPPPEAGGAQIIEVPVRSIVSLSATYLAPMQMLGIQGSLVGLDRFKYVYSPEIRSRIREGKIFELGEASTLNIELLLELAPDLIMTPSLGQEGDVHPKLMETGFKVAINADYMESSPLGRSEWIKFLAVFFNLEQKAEQVFDAIADDYEKLVEKTRSIPARPTVFTEAPYQGSWWVPGGRSYMATLLSDAGARYIWSDDRSTGSVLLDFESVFEAASQAEFWLNTGTWNSLAAGLAVDERFREFGAFQAGDVYNNNARVNKFGGNDYWESGVARPNEILADLIRIFHPALLPSHQLKYYRRLGF